MSPIKQELLAAIDAANDETLQQTLKFLQFQLQQQSPLRTASGRSFLRHAGKWQGDDFEQCLEAVYATRSQTQF